MATAPAFTIHKPTRGGGADRGCGRPPRGRGRSAYACRGPKADQARTAIGGGVIQTPLSTIVYINSDWMTLYRPWLAQGPAGAHVLAREAGTGVEGEELLVDGAGHLRPAHGAR
jgi:hypothetical protein